MNKKEAERRIIKLLKTLQGSRPETEDTHSLADDALCLFLEGLGYDEIVAEYKKVEKWFA